MAYRGAANDSKRVMSVTGTAVTNLQAIPLRGGGSKREAQDALITQVDVMWRRDVTSFPVC